MSRGVMPRGGRGATPAAGGGVISRGGVHHAACASGSPCCHAAWRHAPTAAPRGGCHVSDTWHHAMRGTRNRGTTPRDARSRRRATPAWHHAASRGARRRATKAAPRCGDATPRGAVPHARPLARPASGALRASSPMRRVGAPRSGAPAPARRRRPIRPARAGAAGVDWRDYPQSDQTRWGHGVAGHVVTAADAVTMLTGGRAAHPGVERGSRREERGDGDRVGPTRGAGERRSARRALAQSRTYSTTMTPCSVDRRQPLPPRARAAP